MRQSYKRVGKKALCNQSRYARAQQIKRAKKETKKLRNYLGRVLRDVERKLLAPSSGFKELLKNAARIHTQEKNDSPKLYSVHAPEVECIAKGKAHKKYEFGCKVALVTTSKTIGSSASRLITATPTTGRRSRPRSIKPNA